MSTSSKAFEVLNPTADRYGGTPEDHAPRLPSLNGRIVGLVWNGKVNGDVALKRASTLIGEHVPGVRFRFYSGTMNNPLELIEEVARECDAVIAGPGDCGMCTAGSTHDCVRLERRGVPTVMFAAAGFEHDIEASSRAFAMPSIRYSLIPKVINNLSAEESRDLMDPIADELAGHLVDVNVSPFAGDDALPGSFVYAEGIDPLDALIQFNEDYLDRDWGDGYPVWPPTEERVKRLIDGVQADPDSIVCLLPPGNGEATVAKIAVNAAMAGCEPREMPVILAALRAFANKRPVPRSALMSTSAVAPLLLVNGPLARELGINGERTCLGPGRQNRVNIRISRAVVLCLKNIGSWYPGVMDMDTIGSTRKHIVVVAENEDESPWEPFHVTQGFDRSESTVSLFFTSGEWDISIQGHLDAEQLARAIGSFSCGSTASGYFTAMARERTAQTDTSAMGRLLFLPPPHAIPLAEGGFSKKRLEAFLYDMPATKSRSSA